MNTEWQPNVFSAGCRVQLVPEAAARYVILSRRGDIQGKCRKVGRKLIHWTTDGGVRLANTRDELRAS